MSARTRTVIKLLVAVFVILTLAASVLLYYSHSTPVTENSVVILYEYEQIATFDYSVSLKPNIFYNKTTLEKGEGTIFANIADTITVSLDYQWIVRAQEGTGDTNITVRHDTTEYLAGSTWNRQVAEIPQTTVDVTGTDINIRVENIPAISVSPIKNLIGNFSHETGMSITQYNLTIAVRLDITANTIHGQRNDSLTPQLAMVFKSTYAEGEIISMEGLRHNETGSITSIRTTYHPEIGTQRNVSYILSAISFPGIVIVLWQYSRGRPHKPKEAEELIEEIIEPYREIISETDQEPKFSSDATKISMKSLQDLARVSDTLIKPIIHVRKQPDTHIFYVIDETTVYEFMITESSILELMEKEEEEQETE